MNHSSFIEKAMQSSKAPIHLITCKDEQDRDCYYFIATTQENIQRLENLSDDIHDINDYGKILECGFGTEPSEEIKQKIREEYGYDVSDI